MKSHTILQTIHFMLSPANFPNNAWKILKRFKHFHNVLTFTNAVMVPEAFNVYLSDVLTLMIS